MNKVYVRTRSALVSSSGARCGLLLFFYESHDLPVAVLNLKRDAERCLGFGEKETRKEKKESSEEAREEAKTREESFIESLSGFSREPFRVGRMFTGRRMDNRAQFLASLLWSGFTPPSFPFLPPSSGAAGPLLPLSPLSRVRRPQTSSSRGSEVKG